MRVSIIVPTYNNEATIERCLATLSQQSVSDFEALIVNDGSTDKTPALVAAFGDARFRLLHTRGRRGAAAARNVALREARGDYLAFIDGDMSAPPDWLSQLLSQDVDCAGGPDTVPQDEAILSRCIGYSVDSPVVSGGLRWGQTRLVAYLPGTGNLLLRRQVVDDIGLFNEAFADTGEDKEFLYRVRAAGYRIRYVPSAPLWHHRRPDFLQHVRKMFTYGWRRVDIWRRLPATFELPHLLPALLVLLCFASFLLGRPSLTALWWASGFALAMLDALWAAIRLRDARALLIVPWTSAVVPLGYGLGILVRLLLY